MKLAALWSGGKDSVYATLLAVKGGHQVKCLVTMLPARRDSWMFHHPCIELTKLQAKALGVKQVRQGTNGEKELELEDLRLAISKVGDEIDGLVSGAVASSYQRSRIDSVCKELGLRSVTPLWQKDEEKLLREEAEKLEIIITAVASAGLDESWLGRKIDEECIEDLRKLNEKYGIHLSGEGGSYESITLDCPLFKKKIQILESEKIWRDLSGYLKVSKAILADKEK